MSQYQKRNYEELHAYVDSSEFDIDKANYEQIEEMASRVKSAKTMLRLVFKKCRHLIGSEHSPIGPKNPFKYGGNSKTATGDPS